MIKFKFPLFFIFKSKKEISTSLRHFWDERKKKNIRLASKYFKDNDAKNSTTIEKQA